MIRHGSKDFNDSQIDLLLSASECLRVIVNNLNSFLNEKYIFNISNM
jgi:hypothetical protein